jgi:hypothetical protein
MPPNADPSGVVAALIAAVPRILLAIVVAWALVYFRTEIRDALGRLSSFEAFGVKLTTGELRQWANLKQTETPFEELNQAYERAYRNRSLLNGARILWADDHPENNLWERRSLRSLGATIDVVVDSAEVSDRLRRNEYEVVISDRGQADHVLKTLGGAPFQPPYAPAVIIYTLGSSSPPQGAFALTTRPDELLNLVTDALFAKRG